MKRINWLRLFLMGSVCFALFWNVTEGYAAEEKQKGAKEENSAENSPPPSPWTTKVVGIKYADVNLLRDILQPFGNILANRDLKVLTIYCRQESLAAIEEVIKRFDVPSPLPKNIELTAYMLVGSDQAAGAKTPPELDGVIKQLKAAFTYQGFSLMDTLVVRCRDGKSGQVNGVAPSKQTEDQRTLYTFEFESVRLIPESSGKVIRFDRLKFRAKIPILQGSYHLQQEGSKEYKNYSYIDAGISSDVDLREGQKVVVGKAGVDGSNNAIFLVLSAKVMD
jgi:hypothetical protein